MLNDRSNGEDLHFTWQPRYLGRPSLALKKPARRSLPPCDTYRVAPKPGCLTAPSVTIHCWSDGQCKVMTQADKSACCTLWDDHRNSSVHATELAPGSGSLQWSKVS